MTRDAPGLSRNPMRLFRPLVPLLVLAACLSTIAGTDTRKFTMPASPTQRAFIENTNLSAQEFFAAYMSKSVETRRYAELYLLGVLDASEGAAWCDYRQYRTITLGEEIYTGFKELDSSKQGARAAHVILEILGKKFPCPRKEK